MGLKAFGKLARELEAPLGPNEVTELDDIIINDFYPPKDEDGWAICLCPIAACDIIPTIGKVQGDPNPLPEVCQCSARHYEHCYNFTAGTGEKLDKAEAISSIQSGNKAVCRCLIRLQPIASIPPR